MTIPETVSVEHDSLFNNISLISIRGGTGI